MASAPGAPSITVLFQLLKLLAKATARAVLGWGSWTDVDAVLGAYQTWWNVFNGWVRAYAGWLLDEAKTPIWLWLNAINDWRISIKVTIDALIAWWTLAVKDVVAWLIIAKAKIAYICVTSYAFIAGFITYYTSWVQTWLGATWVWVKAFWANPSGTISAYLGVAWSWVKAFFAAPVATIQNYLKPAWDWIKTFYANPRGVIEGYLGLAWAWAKSWFAAPLAVLHSIVGGALQFLLDLFKLNPANVLAFARDALAYWYNIWSNYRATLLAFLHDPGGFVLDMVYDLIEAWVNDWLYDHW